MKVVVANLAGVKIDEDGTIRHFVKAGSRWPMTIGYSRTVDYYPFPFGLAYTTALLKRDTKATVKGIDGVVRDMTAPELLTEIKKENPDVLVTELTALTLKDDLRFLGELKEDTNCKIVVCGNYVSVFPGEILEENDFIDFSIKGEYEVTVKELIENLSKDNHADFSLIDGLAFRAENDQIQINKSRGLIDDLDYLPFPDREDFSATIYPDFTLYSPCINIISSRGCPAGCIYCTDRHILYNSPRYRMRSPQKVVDEMEYCISRYKARQFYFDDQSFVVNKKHVAEICQEILKRDIHIPWTCMGDAMFVDYETLKVMSRAGCIGMKFGVESADPEILKAIDKPLKLEKVKEVVKWCRELGIRTHATFCLGLPGETVETIKKSIAFMEELNVDTAQVSKAIPYPGTPMYEWAAEKKFLITTDLSRYDGASASIINYPNLSNIELDNWYEEFLKRVSRKKVLKYLKEPRQSISIISEIWKRKGFVSVVRSFWTFLKRAF